MHSSSAWYRGRNWNPGPFQKPCEDPIIHNYLLFLPFLSNLSSCLQAQASTSLLVSAVRRVLAFSTAPLLQEGFLLLLQVGEAKPALYKMKRWKCVWWVQTVARGDHLHIRTAPLSFPVFVGLGEAETLLLWQGHARCDTCHWRAPVPFLFSALLLVSLIKTWNTGCSDAW